MTEVKVTRRIGTLVLVAVAAFAAGRVFAQAGQQLPDAVTADAKHYSVEFENDIVRVLRVKIGAGETAPPHAHAAYCAIEITDSSLREASGGAVSNSKAGQVFCGDATSHAPVNVGKAVAESIVVEFKNRQRAR